MGLVAQGIEAYGGAEGGGRPSGLTNIVAPGVGSRFNDRNRLEDHNAREFDPQDIREYGRQPERGFAEQGEYAPDIKYMRNQPSQPETGYAERGLGYPPERLYERAEERPFAGSYAYPQEGESRRPAGGAYAYPPEAAYERPIMRPVDGDYDYPPEASYRRPLESSYGYSPEDAYGRPEEAPYDRQDIFGLAGSCFITDNCSVLQIHLWNFWQKCVDVLRVAELGHFWF